MKSLTMILIEILNLVGSIMVLLTTIVGLLTIFTITLQFIGGK